MRFILLAKATKDFESGQLPDEKKMSEIANWTEALVKAGARIGADRLHPSSKGTRIRYARGRVQVIDGPFAESKELIAGYCLIQAQSLDEAVAWAKRVPFEEGEVEVRPLHELIDVPADLPAQTHGTTRYVALVKSDTDVEAGKFPDEKFVADMGAFLGEAAEAGVFLSGQALQPSSKGARVRYSGRNRLVIDGPFAESKELVAGFMLLQFKSKEEAVEWTRRFVEVDAPGRLGHESECEIRPVFEYEDYAPGPALGRFRRMGIGPKD
jgi:hypothetical protein